VVTAKLKEPPEGVGTAGDSFKGTFKISPPFIPTNKLWADYTLQPTRAEASKSKTP
jgi:hypothetical protein